MKRMIFLLPLIAIIFLPGFQGKKVQSRCVTLVEVNWNHDGTSLHRRYTQEEKMRAVLMYLRLVKTGEAPAVDPETTAAEESQITLVFSNGEQRSSYLKGHRYFRKDSSGWKSIPPWQAAELYALLRGFNS